MNTADTHPEEEPGYEVRPTPEIFQHYCAYVRQRKSAVAGEPEGSHWRLKEPEEIGSFGEFVEFWPKVAPLIHRELVMYLGQGWEALRQHVEESAATIQERVRRAGVGAAPSPELFRKMKDFWDSANNNEVALVPPRPPRRIKTYEEFVMCWVENPEGFATVAKDWFEKGYEEYMRESREAMRRIWQALRP